MRRRLFPTFSTAILLLGLLGACSSDDGDGGGGPGPIIPEDADLSIRFRVYQTGDTERLLWKGTFEGPDADSPQRTAIARIPAAEPFRVEWELADPSIPILGYQYRSTQDPREGDLRLPRDENEDPVWGAVQSLDYENSTPIEFITSRCPSGGDCPEILLFGSDEIHTLYVFAGTEDGQESTEDEARLEFEIANADPETELVQDGEYPYWRIGVGQPNSLAEGDTIPAGATVVFKLSGVDPDPVVLKLPLPRVRYQANYHFVTRSGPERELSTFYSSPSEADTVEFVVGPFSYHFSARAVDRLRAVDPSPVTFDFHAGFAPRMLSLAPDDGDVILLRESSQGSWAQNTVDYGTPLTGEKRYWDGRRFYTTQLEGTEEWTGTVFRVPMAAVGEGDPREPASLGYGAARAFVYEWFGDNDPDNNLSDGGGFDDATRYDDANYTNEYRLEGEEAVEIFVPDILWGNPGFFEVATCGDQVGLDFCGVGDLLRRQLGQITLRARTRHTANNQVFVYWSNTVKNDGVELSTQVDDWGLQSDWQTVSFPFHLGLEGGSGEPVLWPAQN